MVNQKEAVYQAVTSVLTEANIEFETNANEHMNKEFRSQVNAILVEGFKGGQINYDGDIPEDTVLRAYVSGLTSNWLRKDGRLNGGTKYVAKNPGSRVGSADPQVKAMRLLLASKTDESERAEIQSFIDKRLGQIKPTKTVTINVADLPAELQHLVK